MKKVIVVLGILLVGQTLFWNDDVLADADNLVLSIGLQEEYLDNIFFDPDDKVDDFITTLSTGIEMRKRTERLRAGLQGVLDAVVYVENDDLNNLDQFYKAYARYLVSERLFVVARGSYKNDSRPDRDVEETGLILSTNVRKTQRYEAKVGYELSELSDASLRYRYRKEDYDVLQNDDYDAHFATAQWKYDIGRWITGARSRTTIEFSNYNYRFSRTNNYSATLGIGKELSELYHLYIDLGGRYSEYEFFNDDDFNVNDEGMGGILKAGLKYNGEYVNTNVSILHDIAPASGQGRTLERTSIAGTFRYRLTEKFSSGLQAGYYWNRGDVSADPLDERTIRIAPQLIYQLAYNMQIKTAYTYTNIDSDRRNADKDRHDVFIKLAYNHSFFD